MTRYKRKITKEQYDNAMNNKGFITDEDMDNIFTNSEVCGYGVYFPRVVKENGEYYVTFSLGSSCD